MPLRPISHHPVRSLLKLIRDKKLRTNVLVVPGDVTNKADLLGLRMGWEHARAIRSALKARHVIATLGNHEIYREAEPPADPLSIAKDAHDEFPVSGESAKEQYWNRCFCIKSFAYAAYVTLNTVPLSDGAQATGGGGVSGECLDAMDRELANLKDAPFRIAVCHHHPIGHDDVGQSPQDLMENADKLLELLGKHRFDLVIHGHKHYPRLRVASTGGGPIAVLAAGSLSAVLDRRLATRTRNTFHVVRLERESKGTTCRGMITTWEFHLESEWKPASKTSADLPHESGFGSATAPDQLAAKVAASMEASRANEFWDDIVAKNPDVQYLDEGQRASFDQTLRDQYRMEVEPPSERPRRISRLKGDA